MSGPNRWHAGSIATNPSSCDAARALSSTRFLSSGAPALPLTECTRKDSCRCLYKHHADRRANARRREEITGFPRNVRVIQERRVERDRRAGHE